LYRYKDKDALDSHMTASEFQTFVKYVFALVLFQWCSSFSAVWLFGFIVGQDAWARI